MPVKALKSSTSRASGLWVSSLHCTPCTWWMFAGQRTTELYFTCLSDTAAFWGETWRMSSTQLRVCLVLQLGSQNKESSLGTPECSRSSGGLQPSAESHLREHTPQSRAASWETRERSPSEDLPTVYTTLQPTQL